MSPHATPLRTELRGFPRVSGDEPESVQGQGLIGKFSPRERG